MLAKILESILISVGSVIGAYALFTLCLRILDRERRGLPHMSVTVTASDHCCGIYEMTGVRHSSPELENIDNIISRTKWDGKTAKIIQFSDSGHQYGTSGGGTWKKHLISLGYRVDEFRLGKNPKTNNQLHLYHWYLTPKNSEGKAMQLSIIREYTYEQEQQESSGTQQSQPGTVTGTRAIRDSLGRFVRRRAK